MNKISAFSSICGRRREGGVLDPGKGVKTVRQRPRGGAYLSAQRRQSAVPSYAPARLGAAGNSSTIGAFDRAVPEKIKQKTKIGEESVEESGSMARVPRIVGGAELDHSPPH